MSVQDIIRAWKDEEYRLSLSDEPRAQLGAHPVGIIELDDAELDAAVGGMPPRDNGGSGVDSGSFCTMWHWWGRQAQVKQPWPISCLPCASNDGVSEASGEASMAGISCFPAGHCPLVFVVR